MAVTDGLTKLYNRHYLMDRFEDEFWRAVRHKLNLSVLMVDIDHFKKINDTYGHFCGDAILREISKLFKKRVRNIDTVSRFGGEEFVFLLPETDIDGAMIVAEDLRYNIERHQFACEKTFIRVTVSIGVASCENIEMLDSSDALLSLADDALYRAKYGGRNRVAQAYCSI